MQSFGVKGLEQLSLNQRIQSQLTAHQREDRGVEVLSDPSRSKRVRFTGAAAAAAGGSIEGFRVSAREGKL